MQLPALDGTLSFESVVDFHLAHNADHTYAVFPAADTASETSKVSFLGWGRAVHRAAYRLRPSKNHGKGEVVALIANCDTLLYTAVLMGMIRGGLTPFPISPRNSGPAVCSMLEKTNCHRLVVTSSSVQGLIHATKAELDSKRYDLQVEEIPALKDLFPDLGNEDSSSGDFEPYPSLERLSPDDVLIYIHSSGSTGFPKPIAQTVRIIKDWCNQPPAMDVRGLHEDLVLGVAALPAFHTLGFTMQIILPLITGKRIALFHHRFPEPPVNPNPDNTLEALRLTGSNCVIAVPSFFEAWANSKEGVEFLASCEFAASSGGPLSSKVGDYLVSQGVRLVSLYGATEMGIPMSILPDANGKAPEDWQYIAITERSLPRWIPQGDGSYELQMLNTDTHHVAKINLADVDGYATSDVFVKHPTKENLWKVVGRSDDVLILANGEKTVPGPLEGMILAHPMVQGAIMFGRERNQVGVLVEPKAQYAFDPSDQAALAAFRNSIWPAVEEANDTAPAFSRIFKEMILVTSPWKPMMRAPKGTVMRKATLNEYAQEIEDLLSATFLRNRIIGALRSSESPSAKQAASQVNQNIVFANPTIKQLANKLVSLVDPQAADASSHDPAAEMIDMIAKYSATLAGPKEPKAVVLLTGSTGTLGTHLLFQLLRNENVAKVYAYNRKSSAASSSERQKAAFVDKGFDAGLLEDAVAPLKVEFLEGDAAHENLGLDPAVYAELQRTCTHIIHNAWRLDFNLSLSSFESHVAGVRSLLALSLSSPHWSRVRFLFTSSIAVLQHWDTDKGPAPEEGALDAKVAVGNGYGESKYVAEQLILKTPLQSTSFRIGQISGGEPSGSWALTDWVPIMIKSSIGLGALPNSNGMVSWLPMHSVAQSILDVAFTPEGGRISRTLHLVHPRPVPWTNVIAEGQTAESTQQAVLPLVPFDKWVELVKKRSNNPSKEDLEKIPAIKLLEFFTYIASGDLEAEKKGLREYEMGNWARLATTEAVKACETMKNMPQIGKRDVDMWIDYWISKGLFQ
ncbi:acetyl-CoA synthetase-like protein [Gloeophyllum trabeum ATCC 11539]|uniref:Acetyl-CoA synthetase-like protein n=1 Tax=Gloeophyllum trabeum (strain ATCC 11539 / FP-39264 / Madison 617) TaxID=670483 RepID=S7RGF3_GLOTA|nr:acetyl-CoA synthetase-like protein [Gloeophyllum trabeum ATCC 11539]EPQ53300.1 acetyl-CoA synthetase-like protein [Gloeophyllum trabeum ATCC 11539]